MPLVTVQLTSEGTEPGIDRMTAQQKAAIFKGMSQVLLDVLGKPHEFTWVIIQEVEPDDWGWGGMPAMEYREQLAARGATM